MSAAHRSGDREKRRVEREATRETEDDENIDTTIYEETSSDIAAEAEPATDAGPSRRESLTVGQNVLDSAQQLQEWVDGDPEGAYQALIRLMAGIERASSEVTKDTLEREKQELLQQLEDTLRQIESLQNDNDRMTVRLARSIVNRTDSTPVRNDIEPRPSVEPKKSYKLPDPPLLDDGKNPRFEDWQLQMQNKLKANADHFSTPDLRMAYVASRCTGRAAKHITPRMRDGSTMPYEDSIDMMKHLDEIFGDPNRLVNARRGYRELVMRNGTDFNTFLSDFLHLADEAGVPKESRKEDFYQKLSWDLQDVVIAEADDATIDFLQFTKICLSRWNRKDMQASQKRRGTRNRAGNSTATTAGASKTPAAATATSYPSIKQERELTPTLSDRMALMKEGRCFICKEKGHISRECPKKKPSPLAVVTPQDLQQHEAPRTEEQQSEKDHA